MSTNLTLPIGYPSYARWYWSLWCAMVVTLVSFTTALPFDEIFVWFVIAEGLLGVGVFHFEYGRFVGYLKSNDPQRLASMESKFLYGFVYFFHPALWREVFTSQPGDSRTYIQVRNAFRTTYIFSWVTIVMPMGIVWSGLYTASST
jgi:hypothetical protein